MTDSEFTGCVIIFIAFVFIGIIVSSVVWAAIQEVRQEPEARPMDARPALSIETRLEIAEIEIASARNQRRIDRFNDTYGGRMF
jgi:hypothetical protein